MDREIEVIADMITREQLAGLIRITMAALFPNSDAVTRERQCVFLEDTISSLIKTTLALEPPKAKPSVIPDPIICRYGEILRTHGMSVNAGSQAGREHLLWMLDELMLAKVTGTKAHRWLGYIQGVLAVNGLIKVDEERDFTRPFFKGTDTP